MVKIRRRARREGWTRKRGVCVATGEIMGQIEKNTCESSSQAEKV
jgi:hypothetical protein